MALRLFHSSRSLETHRSLPRLPRRRFLQSAAGATFALAAAKTRAPATAQVFPDVDIRVRDHQGQPLPVKQLDPLYFLDLHDEPLPSTRYHLEPGRLRCQLPHSPVAIALDLAVNGFGKVRLYADNQGQGYDPTDFPLDLNLELARSRYHRVQTAITRWQSQGFQCPASVLGRLHRAAAHLRRAESDANPGTQTQWCDRSLSASLWAGEMAVLAQAQQVIAQGGTRPGFRFGCNFFHYPALGEDYAQRFRALFDFATLPFYWRDMEPQPGQVRYEPIDQQLERLQALKITAKGHPLTWFNGLLLPEWVKQQSYSAIKDLVYQRAATITARYGARIPYYDVINEAHSLRSANALAFSDAQMVELTRLSAQGAKAGYGAVKRIVNSCCLWAENVAYDEPPQRSPFQYLQACLRAEIEFELIGLQVYYPHQDMFEINRLLERFGQLGKPIHITELGVSSATGPDERALIKTPKGRWHASWSESIQADWIEQFYTLCFSKPYIEAITWWDFADQLHFWPHGGLLAADLQPKQSYYRLQRLLRSWRKGNVSVT